MKSSVLFVLLLCLLSVVQVQTEDSTLKLCGRAFVRALVYTCGGSRWRRLTQDDDTLPQGSRQFNVRREMDRQWRDQNQALKTECCEVGCRRADLSMLC